MAQRKKVLVVCQHFWPEAFRINDICDFLIEKGCRIDVLCGIPNYPQGKFFDGYSWFQKRKQIHNRIKIQRVFEIPRGSNSNFRIFLNYISFPLASLLHVPRLLLKSYDKILIYQLSPVMMTWAGIIIGKIRRTETTMYVLDLWPENLFSVLKIKQPFLRKIAATVSHWHYRKVDKLIVLSEKMKERLVEITGIAEDKVIILPQACEKVYEKNLHDSNIAQRFKDGFNILFTGNISPAQSFETIIEAAQLLKSEGIRDINWIIVGDGMSRSWLEKEVKKADLFEDFYFEGFKPIRDIPKYADCADALVACLVKSDLLEATIPAKVMSYIAAGRPMILAMDGEVRGLVNNTIGCGLAGPTEDAKALAANVRTIYHMSGKERQAMGARGRVYHFRYFERNLILNNLYKFIFD